MSNSGYSRRIEVRVPSRDFSEGVRAALEGLGYELVRPGRRDGSPDARFVAAGRLRRLSAAESEPIVLFGGPRTRVEEDPRVVGLVQRPAELLDLYALLQAALEEHPRAAPRICASLPARSLREGVETPGAILSLSEKGCLLRSAAILPGDGLVRLQFALPDGGLIYTRAEPRHQTGRETGLAFASLPEPSRLAIAAFVMRSLVRGLAARTRPDPDSRRP